MKLERALRKVLFPMLCPTKMNLWNKLDKSGRIHAICGAKIQEEKHNQISKTEVLQLPSAIYEIQVPRSKKGKREVVFLKF